MFKMSKFQKLVESQLNNDSLNEGLRSSINNSKIGSKINNFGSNVAEAGSFIASKARFVSGLTTKSNTSSLAGAVNHMNMYSDSNMIKKVASIVTKHPKATGDQLGDVIRKSPEHALDAVNHANADVHTLKAASSHVISSNSKVLNAVVNHPHVTADILNHAAIVATRTGNHDAIKAIVGHPKTSAGTLTHIALTHTGDDAHSTLNKISNHANADHNVHEAIAGNASTSTHTLRQLANKNISNDTASKIARHENTAPATIHQLVTKESQDVAAGTASDHRNISRNAVKNPNISPETLDHIASNISTRYPVSTGHVVSVLSHPKTPTSALRTIYNNHPEHRDLAMDHPNGGQLRKFALPI